MRDSRKHIALLLLGTFLFPQVVNGMHYLMVPHTFSSENSGGKIKLVTSDPDLLFHSCHYHLHSSPSVLYAENSLKDIRYKKPPANLIFGGLENYVHQQDFNFQLRGPPFINY